jgi:hypothetical protein
MTALAEVAKANPEAVFKNLDAIKKGKRDPARHHSG